MRQSIEKQRGRTLSDTEVRTIVAKLVQQEDVLSSMAQRCSRRFTLLNGHHLVLGFNEAWGRSVTITPLVRGVSREGISALHSTYLPPGLRVACLFSGPGGSPGLRVAGEITRCRPIRGVAYELEVKFETPAAVYPFVRLESDDPSYERNSMPYPAIETAKRQFVEMVRDGAPLAMLREGLTDIQLAIHAEEQARNTQTDPNTQTIGPEELDEGQRSRENA